MAVYTYSNADENRFWLTLMVVKARIIYNSLPPDKPEVQQAQKFNGIFEDLSKRARQNPMDETLAQLNREAYEAMKDMRKFFLGILSNQLTEGFYLNLKPSFINHIVSLADEYIYLLGNYLKNQKPRFDPFVQDIFWLPIFQVDARLIADNVMVFDESIRTEAEAFEKDFISYFQNAIMMQGFLRTGLSDFPIAIQYRKSIREMLGKFAIFIVDLLELANKKMLPGTLTLLELDCAYRILCYYTTQLSILGDLPKPACDPGSPLQF